MPAKAKRARVASSLAPVPTSCPPSLSSLQPLPLGLGPLPSSPVEDPLGKQAQNENKNKTTEYTKNKEPGRTAGCLTGNDMREKLYDESGQELGEHKNEDEVEISGSSEDYLMDGELNEEQTLQIVETLMCFLLLKPVNFYMEPFHRKLASLLIMVRSGAAPVSDIVLEARMAHAIFQVLGRFEQ